jgi:hypothetical protein
MALGLYASGPLRAALGRGDLDLDVLFTCPAASVRRTSIEPLAPLDMVL